MAHPYQNFRQSKMERSRAAERTKGYAGGGHVDAAEDKAQIKKMVRPSALKVEGKKSGGRLDKYARGGPVAGKKGSTNVNVIIAPQGGQGAAPLPAPPLVGGPPMPPAGGPPVPPMVPLGGGPPGMAPPGQRSGGRTFAKGGKVSADPKGTDGAAWKEGLRNGTQVQHADGKKDGADIYRPKQITYAKGGGVEASSLVGGKNLNMATMGWKGRGTNLGKMPGMSKMKYATGGPIEANRPGPSLKEVNAGFNGIGTLEKIAFQKKSRTP